MGNKYSPQEIKSVNTKKTCLYQVIQLNNIEVATCSSEKNVDIWNMETGLIDITLTGYETPVTSLVLMHDGRLATGSFEKSIRIWTYDNHRCDFTLMAHEGPIRCLIQLQDHNLASGSDDKKIKILNLDSMWFDITFTGHEKAVTALSQLLDGRLVSGSEDNTIKIWDIKIKKLVGTVNVGSTVSSLLVVNKSGLLLVGCYKKIEVIDCHDKEKFVSLYSLKGHNKQVNVMINVGNDGKRVVSGGGGSCRIWNLEKRNCEMKIEAHKNGVYGMNFLMDGRLITCGGDGELKIWNIANLKEEDDKEEDKKETKKTEEFQKSNKVSYAVKDDVKTHDINKVEKFLNKKK